jgi:hypothetical protein
MDNRLRAVLQKNYIRRGQRFSENFVALADLFR